MDVRLNIWQIMLNILFGIEQRVKWFIPGWILNTEAMNKMPPDWWYRFKRWETWYYATDVDGRPLSHWFGEYFDCCWSWLGWWVKEVALQAQETAITLVKLFTGVVQYGYGTFENWITAVGDRVGNFLPFFADSLADAAKKLYYWLPIEIRNGLQTWYTLFENIRNTVYDWAQARYDDVRGWYFGARYTLEGWVNDVRSWWLAAGAFLDDFRHNAEARVRQWLGGAWNWLVAFWSNPVGTITGYLGATWNNLAAFARDCLVFWYNLWGEYGSEIGAFFGNPLRWLYDRTEDFLISLW